MKALLLILLLSVPSYATQLTHKEEMALKAQKEKDDQEYRLAVLKVVGTVTLATIAALVQIYLSRSSD